MKRWKIGLLVCFIVVCLSATLAGCNSSTYTPQGKDQTVAASALGKNGTLRVGVNASSAPLAGQTSSSSRIVGIDVDAAAYIADELGLKLEIIDVGNDPVSALKNGKVDVVLGVDSASDGDADYWRSADYLETGVALFGAANESSVPTLDSNPQIAAQASSKSSWRVTNLYGDSSLVSQSDLKSAFQALANGTVRYVAADAVIGTYVAHSNGYSDKIVALLQNPSGYCAAVSSSNTELQSAISSAVNKLISGGMMDVIENKWLGTSIDLDNITIVKSATSDTTATTSSTNAQATGSAEGQTAEATTEGTSTEGTSTEA